MEGGNEFSWKSLNDIIGQRAWSNHNQVAESFGSIMHHKPPFLQRVSSSTICIPNFIDWNSFSSF